MELKEDCNGYGLTSLEGNPLVGASILNGGHSGYIGRENLWEMGIYQRYFQKSDVKIGL